MKENKKQKIYTFIKMMVFVLMGTCVINNTITSDAAEYDTSLSSIAFHDHNGMIARANINGRWEYVYCIQRGYPFRSYVSELQMVYANIYGNEGTIASNIRDLLAHAENNGSGLSLFRGWGDWELNGDHTDADVQVSTDGAPSSEAWQEVFTEFRDDDEDDAVNNKFEGSGDASIREWMLRVGHLLTGHEGSLPARSSEYKTRVKEISYTEAGVNMHQVYAYAMTNYYCNLDPDTANYSEDAKYLCNQSLDWAIQYGFITTEGEQGDDLMLVYKDSSGKYGVMVLLLIQVLVMAISEPH